MNYRMSILMGQSTCMNSGSNMGLMAQHCPLKLNSGPAVRNISFASFCERDFVGCERPSSGIIRIYHECEAGIDNSIPVNVWHCEACRVMTNIDLRGRIFLSHPHTNNGFVFLLAIKYHILMFKNGFPEIHEYALMLHNMNTLFCSDNAVTCLSAWSGSIVIVGCPSYIVCHHRVTI